MPALVTHYSNYFKMARAAVVAVLVLIASVQYCSGQNFTDDSELGRATNFVLPRSCADPPLKQLFTGVHEVQPSPGFGSKFEVLCDQTYDKGGWIVIQNRLDGSVYFKRGMQSYADGFGNLKGEFWLGLDKIAELTQSQKFELAVVMTDWSGNTKAARYTQVVVGSKDEMYALVALGTFSGNAGDSLTAAVGAPFSTFDNDNMGGCAVADKGAWWYVNCGDSNLNGVYVNGGTGGADMTVNFWKTFDGTTSYSLKSTRMMIRPVKP